MSDMPDHSDELKDKLSNYYEEPEGTLWHRIAEEVTERSIKDQLQQYIEEPDQASWHAVHSEIRKAKLFDRLDHVGRIAAAVAFVFLLFPGWNGVRQNLFENENANTSLNPTSQMGSKNSTDGESLQAFNAPLRRPEEKHREDLPSMTPRVELSGEAVVRAKVYTANNDGSGLSLNSPDSSLVVLQELKGNTEIVALNEDTVAQDIPAILKDSINIAPKKRRHGKESSERSSRLYALVMPTFGFQQVKPLEDDGIVIESIEKISAFSTKRLGVRAEIGYEFAISNKWSFSAGIFYLQRKQTIQYNYLDERHVEVRNASNELTYEVVQQKLSSSFEYELHNVGLVFGSSYFIRRNAFEHRVGLGAEMHRPIASSSEVSIGPGPYLFANAFYRVSYTLNRRLDLMVQPTLNYGLQLDERLNAPFYIKPYGLGMNFGVMYQIKTRAAS